MNLLEKPPSRKCNQKKQLLDACRHCLLCLHPAHRSTCFAASYKLKGAHKHPQFLWLEFHRSPCERLILSEMVVVAQFGSSHPGLPAALGALAVGGGQGEVGQSSSQVGSIHSTFYDLHGGESFRVFSRRCPFSSPFLLTLLCVLLPWHSPCLLPTRVTDTAIFFCCCCC